MKIVITSGIGKGRTKLSAFDNALFDAGIANYNLIPLSSVIPKNSEIEIKKYSHSDEEYGYKLYVVLSYNIETRRGKGCYAGLGWVQANDGRGLFVEHKGSSEEQVKTKIKRSLNDMVKYREESLGKINFRIVGTKCVDKPVCALVCAIYKKEGW